MGHAGVLVLATDLMGDEAETVSAVYSSASFHEREVAQMFGIQGVPTVVTYHPAYLLRSLPEKAKAWEDLCFARETFAEVASGNPASATTP